ncbi:hypothetical protein RGT46_14875, partial [Enterococcus faecalis]
YYKSRLTTTPLVAGNTKNINYGKFDDEMGEPIEFSWVSTGRTEREDTLLLKIPANTPLKAKQYNATITWDIAVGP